MAKLEGTLYSIEWRGYNRPDGWPRVLADMFVIGHLSKPPAEIANFPYSLGGGYSFSICHIAPPLTPLRTGTLARIRRQRLERRLQAKVPMFATQFASEEISRKSDYYDGETRADIEAARESVLAEELERYNDLISRSGRLMVYASEPEECKRKAEALRVEMAAIRVNRTPLESRIRF
jgi:hypothetical protein